MATYKVTLTNTAHHFNRIIAVPDTESILNEAFEQGIRIPFECVVGACGICEGKLVAGSVDQSEQIFLSDDQVEAGHVLLCVAKPTSDCTLEMELDHYF
ncbi:MAG: 2Fe-2S iron-sulfur cluster binding domain-containing protein [Leptolyngbyaceae cyanobacterium CRU_2_3]|nr:2Fe-2S iron-sulfur cluster binding domain-containing protein [Leptolyngbyaceae cyanobacterium CRU_2_3]